MEKTSQHQAIAFSKQTQIDWLLGFVVLVLLLSLVINFLEIKNDIENRLSNDADVLAYRISESVSFNTTLNSTSLNQYIQPIIEKTCFKAITLQTPDSEITIGDYSKKMQATTRHLHTDTPIKLFAWSPHIDKLITQKGLEIFTYHALVFSLFMALMWYSKKQSNTSTVIETPEVQQTTVIETVSTKQGEGSVNKKLKEQENLIHQLTSELNSAHAHLEELQQTKHSILSNMSLELRTPLDAIIGYSELLLEDAEKLNNEEVKHDIQRIHIAGKHLNNLINDVLDLAKIEDGTLVLNPEHFEIQELVDQAIKSLQPTVAHHQNTLTVKTQNNIGSIFTDKKRLSQIFFNMLTNACIYTEQGDINLSVTRETAEDSDFIKIEISDTGIGITQDNINKLFKEFTHNDDYSYDGIGFSVAISRRLSHALGGDISINNSTDKGSNFVITISTDINKPINDKDDELD